jgi:IMP dehydrogenase/GMP reductase
MIELKYALSDVTIQPAVLSDIDSRGCCNPFCDDGMLPLFTAPMTTVIDGDNYDLFKENNITPIIPRTVDIKERMEFLCKGEWCAFGLDETRKIFLGDDNDSTFVDYHNTISSFETSENCKSIKILIDIANGHMQKLYDTVKLIKEKYDDVKLMVGNIANPLTYKICCEYGVDYVRVGIGGGSVCLTSSNTSIHFPLASLLSEINVIKKQYEEDGYFTTKIIADGGIKDYADIIKCLALGADYCMCGNAFSQMLETPGEIYTYLDESSKYVYGEYKNWVFDYLPIKDKFEIQEGRVYCDELNKEILKDKKLFKENYGMSTKKAQIEMGKNELKTSEGKVKEIEVKYTMKQFRNNLIDYLRSGMSYTGKRNLKEFIGNVTILRLYNNQNNYFNL